MDYTILTLLCGAPVDTLEAHVLARAYRAAWEAKNGSAPVGPHVIAGLDLVIDFAPTGQASGRGRVAAPPAGA